MKLIYTDLFHDSPDSYSCNKSCDNCKKKSLKSIDITDAAKTLIELVKEEPLSEGPLKQKFMSSKNKNNIKESQFASFLMTLTLGGYLKEQIRKIKYISVKYKIAMITNDGQLKIFLTRSGPRVGQNILSAGKGIGIQHGNQNT